MSQSLTYHCDVCGAVKKESNHWFRALVTKLLDGTAVQLHAGPRFSIVPWERSTGRPKLEIHLCGLECAHKAMDRALTEGQ